MKEFFKNESGSHRWVRIPPTEKYGRTQTSVITVAITDPNNKFQYNFDKNKVYKKYIRSGGNGGQNVNKVNTKVEVRIHIDSAYWLNSVIKQRLKEIHQNKINSDGELILTCSETRSQTENKYILEKKLTELFEEASKPKAVRNFDVAEETVEKKEFRIKEKKKRSDVKQTRNSVFD